MNKESQNIEWKSILHEEYLKWVSGFANANGGILYIGIDDSGKVAGIENYEELLEQLPNKFRDVLGVFAEVNLLEEKVNIILRSSFPAMKYLFHCEELLPP